MEKINKKEIGIFSGSFNPIHIGHLILVNYMCEFTHLQEVWLVVTPHNPLKTKKDLLDEQTRLKMVQLALTQYKKIKVSDIELKLKRPSYTINTLEKLSEDHPDCNFTLIIGGDNWTIFNKWKDYNKIIEKYKILIYPRQGTEIIIPDYLKKTINIVTAPIVEISSTFIRKSINEGKDMRAFIPPLVYDYIKQNKLYEL